MKDNVTAIAPKSGNAIAGNKNNKAGQSAVKRHTMDFTLLITVVIICAFGLVMLFSASYYYAQSQFGDGFKYLKSQAAFTALGIALMFVLSFIDYRSYTKLRYLLIAYGIVVIMLLCVAVPGLGATRQGARRWLKIGKFTIQPSEFIRFIIVMILAKYMSENKDFMPHFLDGLLPALAAFGSAYIVHLVCVNEKTKDNKLITAAAVIAALAVTAGVIWYLLTHKSSLYSLFKAGWIYIVILVPCIFIYNQPNFSTLILIAIVLFVMLFIGGASPKYIGAVFAIGLVLAVLMVGAKGYRSDRIQAWLHPWEHTDDKSFQVVQSLYALGSGGLFGQGFNASRQKLLFLPYSESDFIFAVICEEFGFLGGFLLIAAYGLIVYRGIRIALTVKDKFASMAAAGITSILAIQVVLNIGVVTGLIPATGQTLPFISAGGTSATVFLSAMGILLNISKFTEIKKG